MKTTIKTILITLTTILFIFNIPLYSRAATIDEIISAGDSFMSLTGEDTVSGTISESDLSGLSSTVSGVLLTIAVAITLISAVVMGINFTIQSVEDKAKIKESMIPWIIGIFISFGAYGIWQITINIFQSI